MASTTSEAGTAFVAGHEGRVLHAYRDAGGVITIGFGFTMLSAAFAAYWRASKGHALRMGDTISPAECDMLLGKLLDGEYAPPVVRAFGEGLPQHRFDGALDVAYNCGPKSATWSWARALAAGSVAAACAKLRATAVTAGGKRLSGLVRRRDDEARLIEIGDYGESSYSRSVAGAPSSAPGSAPASVSLSAEAIKDAQRQLATLGLYKNAIDGIAGKGSATEAAVTTFQKAQGLAIDGVVGPATRAALTRAVEARRATQATGGGAIVGGGGGAVAAPPHGALDWQALVTTLEWAAVLGGLVFLAFLAWRYRGAILHRRTPA